MKRIVALLGVVGLIWAGFVLSRGQSTPPAPITGASIGDIDAGGMPALDGSAAVRTLDTIRVPLGYTDRIEVDITTCRVTSDTTHRAWTVVDTVHGIGEGDHQPYTKHSCQVMWPLSLSTVGWSASDISHAPAPITFYGVDTCGNPLPDDPSYNPCTADGSTYPITYKEDRGTMTVLLFNTTSPFGTSVVPDGMFPPLYLNLAAHAAA